MAERIVIAEDDEDLAFVLREALIRNQYEVEVAPTGGRAPRPPAGGSLRPGPARREAAGHGRPRRPAQVPRAGPGDADHRDDRPRHAADRDGGDHARGVRLLHEAAQDGRVPGGGGARAGPSAAPAAGQGAPGRRRPRRFEEIIGQCEPLKRVLDMAQRAAPTDLTILIQGESGTGKEVLAQRHPPPQPPKGRAAHPRQRRRHPGRAARVRAVRPRARRLHRGDPGAARPLRAGPRGHALSRRDRRHAAVHAGQDPARPAGAEDRARGRRQVHRRRRADRRRHPPEPREDGRRGQVPPGPLLSAPGRDAAPAAAPGAGRRPADARQVPPRAGGAAAVAHGRHGDAGGDAVPLDATSGRAMSGSCSTCSRRAMVLSDGVDHARAPAAGRPEQRGAVPAGGGPDHEARGRLARRHAGGERAPHDPRRARQGGGRAGAGGQDPRHLGAEPLVPGEEAQDPDAPGGRGGVP